LSIEAALAFAAMKASNSKDILKIMVAVNCKTVEKYFG
jgi:hypothetical protein